MWFWSDVRRTTAKPIHYQWERERERERGGAFSKLDLNSKINKNAEGGSMTYEKHIKKDKKKNAVPKYTRAAKHMIINLTWNNLIRRTNISILTKSDMSFFFIEVTSIKSKNFYCFLAREIHKESCIYHLLLLTKCRTIHKHLDWL